MGSDYLTSPFDDLLKPVDDHLIVHNELMTSLILGNRISIHSSEKGIPDLDSIKIAIIGIPEERNSVDYLGDNLNLNEIRKSFYNLYPGNWSSKIADLGNLILGGSPDETYGRVVSLLTIIFKAVVKICCTLSTEHMTQFKIPSILSMLIQILIWVIRQNQSIILVI